VPASCALLLICATSKRAVIATGNHFIRDHFSKEQIMNGDQRMLLISG